MTTFIAIVNSINIAYAIGNKTNSSYGSFHLYSYGKDIGFAPSGHVHTLIDSTWTDGGTLISTSDLEQYKTYTNLSTGWKANGLCYLRKVGKEVHIHIQAINGITAEDTVIMANVPPPIASPFTYLFKDGMVNGYMQVTTDNNLVIKSVTTAAISGDLFYIAK